MCSPNLRRIMERVPLGKVGGYHFAREFGVGVVVVFQRHFQALRLRNQALVGGVVAAHILDFTDFVLFELLFIILLNLLLLPLPLTPLAPA